MMDTAQLGELLKEFFSANSFGLIFLRAILWFVVALVIIASTDTSGRKVKNSAHLKSNLGLMFLFLVLAGGLMYLLFGFVPLI
jgi:hypothetical protein